jgi:hypothetical protein
VCHNFQVANVKAQEKKEEFFHDVAVINVTTSKTIVGQGYNVYINVTAANLGTYPETFNVTAYANTTAIGTQTVTLDLAKMPPQINTTITFTWNTKGFAYGDYTIRGYAWPVTNDVNLTNNSFNATVPVRVTIPGDVDGNYTVNISDVIMIARIFGLRQGMPNFNPNCDIDGDGKITILDLVDCITHYRLTR